jgi:hypothetical protein
VAITFLTLQEYLDVSKKNFEFYHEKELSSTIPMEEKVKYMEEWWSVAHAMVLKEGLRRNSFVRMVEAIRDRLKFRDRCIEVCSVFCYSHQNTVI